MRKNFIGYMLICLLILCGCSKESSDTKALEVTLEGQQSVTQTSETTLATEDATPIEETKIEQTCIAYETNGVTFEVPDFWQFEEETSSGLFILGHGNRNVLLIKVERISAIMRIDTGGDKTIKTKDDVVKIYGINKENKYYNITGEKWCEVNGFEYHDCWYETVESDSDNRLGRSVIIPINEIDGYISISLICEKDKYCLDHIDTILGSLKPSEFQNILAE